MYFLGSCEVSRPIHGTLGSKYIAINRARNLTKTKETHTWSNTPSCYISQLVRTLLLVNLVGRNLLYGPLKFKAVFVAKMFRDLSPSVLDLFSN